MLNSSPSYLQTTIVMSMCMSELVIMDIGTWSQAFDIFVGIFIQRPAKLAKLLHLLSYRREIKNIAD